MNIFHNILHKNPDLNYILLARFSLINIFSIWSTLVLHGVFSCGQNNEEHVRFINL